MNRLTKEYIGRNVILNEYANEGYGLTKKGSTGEITEIVGHTPLVIIKFHDSENNHSSVRRATFRIHYSCIDLIEQKSKSFLDI